MANDKVLDRRDLLTKVAPACAAACLGFCRVPKLAALTPKPALQEPHKFDVLTDVSMSTRQQAAMQNRAFVEFIRTLQNELDEPELLRLLNLNSAKIGRLVGERQASNSPDTDFQTFVQVFRPPNFADLLTHEIVEDTEEAFGLHVRECVLAEAFKAEGMDGEMGHAAVCNMDYYWPPAFNPNFKMERTQTLMQGHDRCNHRYIDTA